MSFQAMTWAVNQKLPTNQKMVLLMLANRTNHDTGRCDPSHKRLADDCGMGISTLKRCLKSLEESGFINVISKKIGDVNLPNQYQLNMNQPIQFSEGVGSDRADPRPDWTEGVGSDRAGVGSDRATKQEYNLEDNNQEVKPDICATPEKQEIENDFELFWSSYPRKVNKKKSFDVFKKINFKKHPLTTILDSIEKWKKSGMWDDAKYIPHATSFLNGERWTDEIPVRQQQQKTNGRVGYMNTDYDNKDYYAGVDADGRF